MAEFVRVAKKQDIPDGEMRTYELGDLRVAVCRVGERFYAIEDVCTHDGAPLGEGCLKDFEIECPRHGARFDVRDGRVTRMPAAAPVDSFKVRVEKDEIFVEVEDD